MEIHGLQKMTLLDFPGRVACTVFLGGCDLRCPFCHNAELIDGTAKPVMDDTELLAFLEKRKGLLDGVALELKLTPEEKEELEEAEGRKLLQREMRDEALRRYEEAARTVQDFKNLHATWDKLDANRERRERYHELLRGNVPIDYDVDYASTTFIPRWRNDPMERQLLRGYFLDYFCDCPYEMHDLTTKEYLRQILMGLKEEHKEIFYFLFLRQFSPQYVALMRGQTDRNIRKVRDTVLRKIRKKMNKQLLKMAAEGYRLGEREMQFLFEYRNNEGTPKEEAELDEEHL